jgi:aryl-phospho-beta-D-glucosidase BglC (GH1 family)
MRKPSFPSLFKLTILFCVIALIAPTGALAQTQTLPTAAQVASQINVGWNIGNSLEAICGETAWGNPAISQQLITAVKNAGFNAVRIPAAWDCHANQSTLTIDAAWIARVKEVVDYAISQNMYVILNIHWDGGWLEEHPLYSYQDAVNQKQNAYWTQIANYFKNYDEHLLFAGTNEVHADYGTPTAEHITVQQSYNQTFVNAVRATGGNNATRTLVVQTYNTNMWHGLNYFSLPTDSASNRLMVEVHHYDPYDYTLNPSGSCLYWGAPYPSQGACTWAQESYVDDLFNQVRTEWVAQGIPVILGEYGVATRPNLNLESRQYYLEYMNAAAAENGIKTFYWDNGVSPTQTNGFALFNRSNGAIVDQGALDAIMRGAGVGNPNVNYTLMTSANGSGTVTRSPNASAYPGGTSITLTATAAAGYDFAGWSGSLSGATNPITFNINSNMSVVANFIPEGTGGTGTILREYWYNITGTTLTSLTSNPNYPNSPTGSEQLTSLEGPVNAAENYGARIRGYIHPSISGAYTFWLASDDYGELRLSTNDNPASATRIAYVDGWTNSREWSKYPSQKSAAINLVAGQKYYIEVLQKEGNGGDNVAVAWQGPGISQAVIGGSYLSPFVPSGVTATATPSRTRTPTRTNTPIGPTRTPTRTNTPVGPTRTPTRTPTPGSGSTCSPVTTTITAPFTFDGAGTFCWQIVSIPNFINSWNLASLTINGVNYTNTYAVPGSLPPKINGFWYVSYRGNYAWSHFEAK